MSGEWNDQNFNSRKPVAQHGIQGLLLSGPSLLLEPHLSVDQALPEHLLLLLSLMLGFLHIPHYVKSFYSPDKIYTSFEAHIKCHPCHWFYSQNMHLFKLPQKMEFLFHSRPASCHAFYSDDYVSVCLSPGLVTAILQNCTIIIHISSRVQSSTFCIGNKYLRILKILDIFKLDNQIIWFSICSFHFSLFMVQVPC